MTKKTHRCDDSCKGTHTTEDAKKIKLPSGTKVKSTKKSSNAAFKKQLDRIEKTESFKKPIITDVYNADYSLIDETIDNIKKTSRSICVDIYSSNNVYLILQEALKKVTLADK